MAVQANRRSVEMDVKCLLWLVMLPALSFAQTQTAASPTQSVAKQFAGAWRLVSVETLRPNGEVIYPFYGKHPEGILTYDASGWMSVQIVSDPKPVMPGSDSRDTFLAAPAADKVKAIEGYYAYYGTWTVDPSASTVSHHIRESLYPAERGEDFVRKFTFEGDRLTLRAKVHEMGEDHVRQLVWERLTPAKQ